MNKKIILKTFAALAILIINHNGWADSSPLAPSIMRNVTDIQDGEFQHPYTPPLRVSGDGRIGISQSNGGFGQMIFLVKPENMHSQNKNFMEMPPGNPISMIANAHDLHFILDHYRVNQDDPGRDRIRTLTSQQLISATGKSEDGESFIDGETIGGPGFTGGMPGLCEDNHLPAPANPIFTKNPYACTATVTPVVGGTTDEVTTTITPGGLNDCYDLTIINNTFTFKDLSGNSPGVCEQATVEHNWNAPATCTTFQTINSRKLIISVANPKTTDAYIAAISMPGSVVRGDTYGDGYIGATHFLEPVITRDGKLMVLRIGAGALPIDPADELVTGFCENLRESGRVPTASDLLKCQPNDVIYSYNSMRGACDVAGWQTIHPISHAYHDPILNPSPTDLHDAKYGFAEYPIRTPDGVEVPDNHTVRASYPWLDSKGTNLVMTIGASQLYNEANTQNRWLGKTSCVEPGCALDLTTHLPGNQVMGYSHFGIDWTQVVTGLWTHGKMIDMDALVNNVDFGLKAPDFDQMYLQLYQNSAGNPVNVRLGTGRIAQSPYPGDSMPFSGITNTDLSDSIEDRWNHQAEFKPALFKDVVWKMQNGKTTDEFAFDDYISPNAYIVSEMVGAYVNDDCTSSEHLGHMGS